MKNNNSTGGGAIGITGLLQVAFIVLKLCNVIHWKWLWVLAPTWISIALAVLLVVVLVICGLVKEK